MLLKTEEKEYILKILVEAISNAGTTGEKLQAVQALKCFLEINEIDY